MINFKKSVTPKSAPRKQRDDINILQNDTARWVLKRKSVNQLGYVRETSRIEAEGQVRLLLQLWDIDNSGTIDCDEIVRGLITLGLGGSLEFTQKMVKFAFRKSDSLQVLLFEDFKKLLMIQPKLKKVIELIDKNIRESKQKIEINDQKKKGIYRSFLHIVIKHFVFFIFWSINRTILK